MTTKRRTAALVAGVLAASLPLTAVVVPASAADGSSVSTSTGTSTWTTLRYGDRGEAVARVQRLLAVKQTGYFGWYTRSMVGKVQRWAKLPVSGIVGRRTYEAIKRRAALRATSRSAAGGTPAASKRYARAYIDQRYGWGATQFSCLVTMWDRESGWRYRAVSPNGRYVGIPQTSAAVWRAAGYTNAQYKGSPVVQITVGASYVRSRYGTPCGAWAFWRSHHWY